MFQQLEQIILYILMYAFAPSNICQIDRQKVLLSQKNKLSNFDFFHFELFNFLVQFVRCSVSPFRFPVWLCMQRKNVSSYPECVIKVLNPKFAFMLLIFYHQS